MILLICGLAVYKVIQAIDALLPKEPMPWVKILAGVALGYGAAFVGDMDRVYLSGLAVATVAGTVHTVLRLATLAGDLAQRKSLR